MFQNTGVKAVTIIVNKKNMQYGMYLQGLIGQRDDEEDKIIGIEDGSVKTAVWTESQYEQNRPTITSEQEIVFVGDSKPARVIAKSIKVKYDYLGMKYGWLGNMAYINVENENFTASEYKRFMSVNTKEMKVDLKDKDKAKKLAVIKRIGSLIYPVGTIVEMVEVKDLKEKMKDERFRYIINHFYLNALQEFLEE